MRFGRSGLERLGEKIKVRGVPDCNREEERTDWVDFYYLDLLNVIIIIIIKGQPHVLSLQ